MIDENLQTQAALYALGALPAGEATAFRARLFDNPELAALVAEYEAAAAVLAGTAPKITPPSALRASILAEVRPGRIAVESPPTAWLPWTLAACLAVACAWLWMGTQAGGQKIRELTAHIERLDSENRSLQWQGNTARARVLEMQARLEALSNESATSAKEIETLRSAIADLEKRNALAEMQVATLTSKLDGSYLASIAWDKDSQEGVLHVRRLPPLAGNQDYQLWVVDPKYSSPVSAGIFKVQPDGSATLHFAPVQRITNATAFAITLERQGGVPKAEGPLILSN